MTIYTFLLIVFLAACAVILRSHSRLLKKYTAADGFKAGLVSAIRDRLDLISETEFIDAEILDENGDIRAMYDSLAELCDDCRFGEADELLKPYNEIERRLNELAGVTAPDMSFLDAATERVREAGRLYNESLEKYFAVAGRFPNNVLAGLFLLKHEEIYFDV